MTAHLHARQQSRERGDEDEESVRSHGEALFNCMSLYAYSMAGQMIFSERGWSAEFAQAKQRSHLAPRDEQKAFAGMVDSDYSKTRGAEKLPAHLDGARWLPC